MCWNLEEASIAEPVALEQFVQIQKRASVEGVMSGGGSLPSLHVMQGLDMVKEEEEEEICIRIALWD